MALPTFIVIGAVKAGTTSLYNYLGQHPNIQMSSKNWPRYFHTSEGPPDFGALSQEYGTERLSESRKRFDLMCPPRNCQTLEQYSELWPDTQNIVARGEVSPTYLHDGDVSNRIFQTMPSVKLVAVLRNPVDRAYSHYVMDKRFGWENSDNFRISLAKEPVDVDCFWWGKQHYIRHSFYSNSLAKIRSVFPQEQLKILLYDDLVANPQLFYREIFEFIGVDTDFVIDASVRHNRGLIMRDTRWSRLLNSRFSGRQILRRSVPTKLRQRFGIAVERSTHEAPAKMEPETRHKLKRLFHGDILRLQTFLDRDLSHWHQ